MRLERTQFIKQVTASECALELTWGDFSKELDYINLSGSRNKSGRNRIVPIPNFIKDHLIKGAPEVNIFKGTTNSKNKDYFNTLWSRYKERSKLLTKGQTFILLDIREQ